MFGAVFQIMLATHMIFTQWRKGAEHECTCVVNQIFTKWRKRWPSYGFSLIFHSVFVLIDTQALWGIFKLVALTAAIKDVISDSFQRSVRSYDLGFPARKMDYSKKVQVNVAGRMEFFIGYLRYEPEDDIL